MRRQIVPGVIALLVVVGACGGVEDLADQIEQAQEDAASSGGGSDDGGGDDDGGSLGGDANISAADDVTVTSDAGTASVEVDGQTFVYTSAEAVGFTCMIGPDQIQVSFQTADGHNLSINAIREGDAWNGAGFTFQSRDVENTQYGVSFFDGTGTLGVSDGAMSYSGSVDKVVDRDIMNPEEIDGAIAVNCSPPGGAEPQAVIGGTTYVFPYSGAQSIACTVMPDQLEMRVNRLSEDLQLSIDVRGGPGDWIGSVFVITPDGSFTATLSGDAEGLTIDGLTVTYVGPIESEAGDVVDADVAITCPPA